MKIDINPNLRNLREENCPTNSKQLVIQPLYFGVLKAGTYCNNCLEGRTIE